MLRKMFLLSELCASLPAQAQDHEEGLDSQVGINANRLGNQIFAGKGRLSAVVPQAEGQRTTKMKGGPVHEGHSKQIPDKTPRFHCVSEGRKQL